MATAIAKKQESTVSQMAVPFAIIAIVLMMVLPVPAMLLDGLLAVSLAIAVGVFLIALFIEQPLDYSVFPAVVLVATLLRLSLNVASTRLILLHGAEGQRGAGRVIETFGKFVIGGDVVVGLVVFLILVIINFVVITKGAGRVAEVAARFTLDAMPGKQMAIDAELNAGLITGEVARTRRRAIEREADFFGAMDGASKFVHGDAVAGIIITFVNLVGGLVRGLLSGMDVSKAVETFSILSVGDALVAQIPALLISTASGIVVTRGATGEELGKALKSQLFTSKRAVGLTAGVIGLFAFIPGMPVIPFVGLAGALGFIAWKKSTPKHDASKEKAQDGSPAVPAKEQEIETSLPLDLLSLEVGYELIPAVEANMGGTLLDRISALRRQFAVDMGVIVPPVRIRDNLALPSNAYRFLILGTEIATGELKGGRLLTMGGTDGAVNDVPGEAGKDPVFRTPARWIAPKDRDLAEALGCTVVDHATILATHLGDLVKKHADQLVGRAELAHLLDVFSKSNPKLVDDLVPTLLSLSDMLKVVRNLLRENVSVRNLRSILEALTDAAPQTKDTEQLTEITRQRLARQITSQVKTGATVEAIVLDANVEDMFRRSLREITQGTGGALDPDEVRRVGVGLEAAIEKRRTAGKQAVVVTGPDLRRYVRAFVERRAQGVPVLSFREVDGDTSITPVETVSGKAA